MTVVDAIDGLESRPDRISDRDVADIALARLASGLNEIAARVQAWESRLPQPQEGRTSLTLGIGNDIPAHEAANQFDWYALSASNFVGLMGWLAGVDEIHEYRARVLGPALRWRDKVAAHLAFWDARREDTTPLRRLTAMTQVGTRDGHLIVGGWTLSMDTQHGAESGAFEPWSVTELHERLRLRYNEITP